MACAPLSRGGRPPSTRRPSHPSPHLSVSVSVSFFSFFSRKKLDKYICISGSLRCSEHTDLVVDPVVCSQCAKQIDGEVILSVGMKLHAACFKCGFCSKALAKATAKLKDDKLCCPECMLKKDPSLRAKNAAAAAAEAQRGGDADAIEEAPKAAAAAPAAAAVATPAPINHDEFTKYVRKPHNRKVSKVRAQKKTRRRLSRPPTQPCAPAECRPPPLCLPT